MSLAGGVEFAGGESQLPVPVLINVNVTESKSAAIWETLRKNVHGKFPSTSGVNRHELTGTRKSDGADIPETGNFPLHR